MGKCVGNISKIISYRGFHLGAIHSLTSPLPLFLIRRGVSVGRSEVKFVFYSTENCYIPKDYGCRVLTKNVCVANIILIGIGSIYNLKISEPWLFQKVGVLVFSLFNFSIFTPVNQLRVKLYLIF